MNIQRISMWRVTVMVAIVSGLSACGIIGMGDLEEFVAQEKAKKPPKIEPIPQIKQYEAFAYTEGSRRDPFVASEPQRAIGGGSGTGLQPDLRRNKEPLEEFPIDALRMVGTIQMNGQNFALVKAPDRVVHRVTRGNHLGQNFGTITKIDDSEITLTEIIPDGFGGWMQRPASLALAQ
jgi:type IV pilus assembly protein PilP